MTNSFEATPGTSQGLSQDGVDLGLRPQHFQEDPKVVRIRSANQLSADFRLVLFSSALNSLKSTTLLKPYPVEYFDASSNEIDRAKLIKAFDLVPSLPRLTSATPAETLDLVHWILTYGGAQIEPVTLAQLSPKAQEVLRDNLRDVNRQNLSPHHIFAVTEPPSRRTKLEKFANLKSLHGSFYAFHGSALENYHSILHNGLASSLNKRSLFGYGTYLSSKLITAVEFSPFGANFYGPKKSMFGRRLSCVALCEVIDHPDVEAKKKKTKDMPDTYFVVSNNEFIRVAYLLVYSSQQESQRIPAQSSAAAQPTNPTEAHSSSGTVLFAIIILFIVIGFFVTRNQNPF